MVWHIRSSGRINLYEGWEVQGYPEKVLLRGQLIVDNGKWLGRPGMGRFIPCQTFTNVL